MGEIIISGIGAASIVGNSLEEIVKALKNGVNVLKNNQSEVFSNLTNKVNIDKVIKYIKNKKAVRFYSLDTKIGCMAAALCLHDAGLSNDELDKSNKDIGVIIGSSYTPAQIDYALMKFTDNENKVDYFALGEKGIRELPPLWMLGKLPNTTAGQICIENNIQGMSLSVVNGMNSGIVSISEAYEAIKGNRASKIICGGVDGEITPEYISELYSENLVAIKSECSIPFTDESEGYVFAEGASLFLLERKKNNLLHGYAEILGYANYYLPKFKTMTVTELSAKIEHSMIQAITVSNIKKADVDFIQSGASGNSKIDYAEAMAIKNIFSKEVKVSSSSKVFGYTRVASGALSVLAACLSFKEGCIFPIMTQSRLFYESEISYIKNAPLYSNPNICIVNAVSYIGELFTLVLRRA